MKSLIVLFCVCVKIVLRNRKSHKFGHGIALKAIMPKSDSDDDGSNLAYDGSKEKWAGFYQTV